MIISGRAAKGRRPTVFGMNHGCDQAELLRSWHPNNTVALKARDYAGGHTAEWYDTHPLAHASVPQVGICPTYDGSFGWYRTPVYPAGIGGTQPFTLSVWINAFDTAGGWPAATSRVFWFTEGDNPNDGTTDKRIEVNADGTFFFSAYDGGTRTTTSTATLVADISTSQLLTGTYDGTNLRIYVDGQVSGTAAACGSTFNFASPLIWWGSAFKGALWDVRVYMKCLSASEIWALYEPSTRYDLYWVPGRRVFFDVAAAAATAARARYFPLLGAA